MLELCPQEVADVEIQSLLCEGASFIIGNVDRDWCELWQLACQSQEGDLGPPESVFCNCHGHRPHASPPATTATLLIQTPITRQTVAHSLAE